MKLHEFARYPNLVDLPARKGRATCRGKERTGCPAPLGKPPVDGDARPGLEVDLLSLPVSFLHDARKAFPVMLGELEG